MYTYQEDLLAVEDVSLQFGDNLVLQNVNVRIKNIVREGHTQGQVVGFLGPSGIGKTRLCRILSGLNKPTSGQVFLNHPTSEQKENWSPVKVGDVGFVAQNYPLFQHRTVMGNLLVAGKSAGLSKEEAEDRANTLLARFHLLDRKEYFSNQISGGQRQRVAIAQQLMCRHKFLLMDEPFSGLDPVMKDSTCHLIAEVAATDELLTIIVVTHDISAAVESADMLWLMGRDTDEAGEFTPGSYIKEQVNLAERGISWRPGISITREFADTVAEIRNKFDSL